MMNAPWQFQFLGRVSARRGEQVITRFSSSRVAALLARLALFPRRTHPREELADLLWPDSDLDAGRLNLRVALASLRRQLEPPDVLSGSVLLADRSSLCLQTAACRCDVAEFEAALAAAAHAPSPGEKRLALDRAVALFSGELLPGFYDDWIVEERERLNALHENACLEREALPEAAFAPAFSAPICSVPVFSAPALPGFPLQFTRFFGREAEIAALLGRLAGGERLVTLTGPGGSGKSRLATEAARRFGPGCPGPLCFVPLADLGDAGLIPEAVARALNLPPPPATGTALEQVVSHLAALPPALLVLDNFEHLVERGAPLLFSLLSRLPALTCLVTSRRRLALPGERELPVPPLPLPDADGTPEAVARTDSARLFADRAQAARPDFQITPGNAAAVAALCRTLEGIPLALELAAARTPALTPAQMNARLAQRFEVLTSRRGEKNGRHRSLWAALSWSYDLLGPELQRFFVRLSVFRGGGTPEAAQAVCAEPQALEYLTQLRERSLIALEDSARDTAAEMRFRLLESLREFGDEQMEVETQAALARRHADWYTALAQDAYRHSLGPDQARWFHRLEADHDNLRRALRFRLASDSSVEEDTEGALTLCASLWRFWAVRGHYAEGRDWMEQALARPGGSARARAEAANGAGNLASEQADYPAAAAWYEENLALMRTADDRAMIATALCNLGRIAMHREDYARAEMLQTEALALRRLDGGKNGIAYTLECLAIVAQHQRRHARARVLHEESLALCEETGNEGGRLWALSNLAALCMEEDGEADAARLYGEALALSLALQDQRALYNLIACFAALAARQGKLHRAALLAGAAEGLRRRTGGGMHANDAADLEAALAPARCGLSPSDYAATWAEGDRMTAEQAVARAREE